MAEQTADCITMDQFETLAIAVARGDDSRRPELARKERHVLSCPHCRETWNVQGLLEQLPTGVFKVHVETIDQGVKKRRDG